MSTGGRVNMAGNEGNADDLIKWYDEGADGGIDWGSKGDFEACVGIAGDHVDDPEGFCAERHHDATGEYPGPHDSCSSARGGVAMTDTLRTRDSIIADWTAVLKGHLTDDAVLSSEEADSALAFSYEYVTEQAREFTGAPAYWEMMDTADRKKAAGTGEALPDGSYPITTCDGDNSVDTAVSAVGRGSAGHNAIRKHIMKRAASLGCSAKIPDNWNADGSLKGASAAAEGEAFAPPAPPAPALDPPPGAAKPPGDGPKPGEPASPTGGPPDKDAKPDGAGEADATVTEAIANAKKAIDNAVDAQNADPDNASDPKDAKVLADLQHAAAAIDQAIKDQGADADETTSKAPAKPTPPPPPGKAPPPPAAPGTPASAAGEPTAFAPQTQVPGNPKGIPGDGDDSPPMPGDIEANVPCENPACGHMALSHADTPDGKNSGACAEGPDGHCPGMVVSGTVVNGPDTEQGGGPDNDDGASADGVTTAAGPPPASPADPASGPGAAPEPPPSAGAPASELPPLNPMPDVVGPAFTCPVAWLENTDTGDGRRIQADALTWRTPPIPLMGLKTSPHDPSGMSGNDPAVLIGRIETITRDGNAGVMKGHLLNTDEGQDFATILDQMGRMGVSIDVGSVMEEVGIPEPPVPTEVPVGEEPFDPGMPMDLQRVLVAGEIMGATVCPFAAFAGAYIVLGDDASTGAATVLPPAPEGVQMAIRYVGQEDCEQCDEGTTPITAAAPTTAGGPVAPPAEWFADPGFTRGDERLSETLDAKSGRPRGKFACPITVTPEGRVYGHVAQWGVCHMNDKYRQGGSCVMAPRSHTGYAWFHTGDIVTAEGGRVSVGRLTADCGHASESPTLTAAQVLAHYDNSGTTAALVRAGEDEFGIWVAGSIHPAASPEQVVTMQANPPSGDWRPIGRGQELVAVLHVNSPGFPMARATVASGRITALVAAGVPVYEMPAAPARVLSTEERLAAMETALRPVFKERRENLTAEMTQLRAG